MDPTITRLAEMPQDMTVDQVSYALNRSPNFVCRACRFGHIEARAERGRGTGANHRYTITQQAVLTYLIATTTGTKALLLGSIAEAFPHLHEWARTIAAGGNPQLPTPRTRKPPTRANEWHPHQLALFTETNPTEA